MFRLGKPKRYLVDLSKFFSLITKSQFGNFCLIFRWQRQKEDILHWKDSTSKHEEKTAKSSCLPSSNCRRLEVYYEHIVMGRLPLVCLIFLHHDIDLQFSQPMKFMLPSIYAGWYRSDTFLPKQTMPVMWRDVLKSMSRKKKKKPWGLHVFSTCSTLSAEIRSPGHRLVLCAALIYQSAALNTNNK